MDEEQEWVERERLRRNDERVGAWHEEKARRASLREEMQEDATADRLLMAEGRRAQRRALKHHQAEREQRAEALVEQIFAERAAAEAPAAQPRRRAAPRRYDWRRAAVMRLDGHSMLEIGHMLDLPLGRVERAFAKHARLRRYMAAEKQHREDDLVARLAALRPQLLVALEARLAVGDPRATIVLAQLLLTPPAPATAQVAAQATLAVDPRLLRQLLALLQGGGTATVLPPAEQRKLPEK